MLYLYAKAVHIIFVVCWMAGLFYMPRLFIYHVEARNRDKRDYKVLHDQFIIMESKLWWIITTPAMCLTVLSAVVMLYINPGLLKMGWMHIKLFFVLSLIIYHFFSQKLMFRLKEERLDWSSGKLRLWNEIPTLILFAIVFIVILKSSFNWIYGFLGLVVLAVVLMILIKIYKRYRMKNE